MRPDVAWRQAKELHMRHVVLLMAAAIPLAFAGCGGIGGPEQVNASAPRVTYRFTNDREMAEATQRAEAFCRNYGKSARLVGGPQSDLATFECV